MSSASKYAAVANQELLSQFCRNYSLLCPAKIVKPFYIIFHVKITTKCYLVFLFFYVALAHSLLVIITITQFKQLK